MRYRLRTLLIVLTIGPALLAGTWFGWQRYLEHKRQREFDELVELIQTTIVVDSGWDQPAQKASPDEN
jgi:hypothetical protein